MLQALFDRSRAVMMVLGLCIVWGIIAYITIPKESNPDVKIPIVLVSVRYDGISPDDAERLLARPLEQELKNINGVKEIKTSAYEGGVHVTAEFFAGLDIDKARKDVIEKTELAKTHFPKDAKEPLIEEINLGLFPVLSVKISGEIPKRILYKIAKNLQETIESNVQDVLKAKILGDQDEVVEIIVDPLKLEQYAINPEQVLTIFSRNNQVITAGFWESANGRFSVKIPALIENAEQIATIPIKSGSDHSLLFKDIAEIHRTFKDPVTICFDKVSKQKMQPAVVIEISKRTGTHLIETVAAVKNVVNEFQKTLPQSVHIQFSQDQSDKIFEMIGELENSIILAVLLVIGVIIWALGPKSALIVGIVVPGSFLMGMMILQLMGLTVNIVVLFSLIFSVGMLVDGAIIVVEYADHLIKEGHSVSESYFQAAKRMTWPVITSISTILVVFIPLLFWPGFVGQFMKYMPITLLAVLSASIAMALIFVPVIAGYLKPSSNIQTTKIFDEQSKLMQQYKKALNWCLAKPKRIIKIAVAILIGVKLIHSFLGKGVEFFPDVEPDQVMIFVHGKGNLSITEKEHFVSQVTNKIVGMREIKAMHAISGDYSDSKGLSIPPDAIGTIYLEFIDWQARRKVKEILPDIEKQLADIAGVWIEVVKQKAGPPSTKAIEIELSGLNQEELNNSFNKLKHHLMQNQKLVGIEDNLPVPGIEWAILLDRQQANTLGTDVLLIGNTLKMLTNGTIIGTYRPDDVKDEIDVVLRFPKQFRDFTQLNTIKVPGKKGMVPLKTLSEIKYIKKQGQISKVDGYKILKLMTNVTEGTLVSEVVATLKSWINQNISKNVTVKFKGEDKEQQESGLFLMKAFGVAIFLVALILVIEFNSFFSMGLVLSAVVMSTVGVFVGLMVHNLAFGVVMGGIGVIALAGIIVSNNILLIDTYDLKIKENQPKTVKDFHDVIVATCLERVRPVILTKLTAILGLLPIMFGINIDFFKFHIAIGAPSNAWWTLLATCIIYGILFASSLTLLVTPAALMLRAEKLVKKLANN
jgi:multidrug efflux pump